MGGDPVDATTLLQQKFRPTEPPSASFSLVVADGPDRGARLDLDGSQAARALVGLSPACDLRLTDRLISRRHAAFEIVGARLRVIDLGSTNGTRVGAIAISDAFLEGGETLTLGASRLSVERRGPAANVELPPVDRYGKVLGASREMRRLYPLCERLAASRVPVVIEGETGTGKEVLAEALHENGPRNTAPFAVFDCTAVPANLMESELFGHERGAFTGAVAARKGILEEADGGTLLIDEIGDLDLMLQPKLLRALERGEVRRVGGDRWLKVDVRVLSATRRNLDLEVQEGRFRDDLFHRLAVARIELPPLRERKGDVAVLASHFWDEMGGERARLTPELLARWSCETWPGNVRELRNAVAREVTLGELAEMAREKPRATVPPPAAGTTLEAWVKELVDERITLADARRRIVTQFERRYIVEVLAAHGGNVTRAAAASGVPRRYFQILKARGT